MSPAHNGASKSFIPLGYLQLLVLAITLFAGMTVKAASIRKVTGSTLDQSESSAVNLNFQNVNGDLLNCVHKTSTETIHGNKYFSDSISGSTITYTGQLKTPLTASRAAVIDSAQQLSTSAVTTTELGYVSGVTSPIQTQLTSVGMVFISSASAATSSSISFTGLAGASYSEFVVLIDNVVPSSNTVNLKCQISTGAGFLTTNYRHGTWRWTNAGSGTGGSTADSSWIISSNAETLGTGANQAASFEVHFHGPNNTTALKRSNWLASGLFASVAYVYFVGGGEVDTQSAVIDGIQFSMSSGNISTGKFYLFGIRN